MSNIKHFAVLGQPIEHSLSPQIHTLFAQQLNIQLDYQKVCLPIEEVYPWVDQFRAKGGCGLNVTLPYKQLLFNYCDQHSIEADQAEAVNTLSFANNTCLGSNTDGIGLVYDLVNNLGQSLSNRSILILGAGGAARGIIAPLLQQNPKQLLIANRSFNKAEQLAALCSNPTTVAAIEWQMLATHQFGLVINATSASLSGASLVLPNGLLKEGGCVYDLVYAARPTWFMRWGQQQGAALAADGLGMLVEQAAAAFYIWHQLRPKTSEVIQHMRRQLKQR